MAVSRFGEWALALGLGLVLGWGGTRLANRGVKNVPTTKGDRGESGKDLADCFLGKDPGVDEGELFKLQGKVYAFGDLPLDAQTALVKIRETGFRQSQELLEDVAMRLTAETGKTGGAKTLLPIEEAYADQLKAAKKETEEFYKANRTLFPGSLEQARPTVERYLAAVRLDAIKRDLRGKLALGGTYQPMDSAPCVPAVAFDAKALPQFGDPEAPQSMVFVTDYFSGVCRELMPRLGTWLKARPKEFKVAVMVSQLGGDASAAAMNQALFCASKQGGARLPLFLEQAHLVSINFRGEPGSITGALREQAAAKAQLDVNLYDECLKSPEALAFTREAARLTTLLAAERPPVLLVNGRRVLLPLDGAAAQARIQSVIEAF